MNKGKSITLLSIVSVIIAFVLVMTFIVFPVGVKNYNSLLGAVELDYDLEGGVAYTLTLSKDNEEEVICQGYNILAFINENTRRPHQCPEWIKEKLKENFADL